MAKPQLWKVKTTSGGCSEIDPAEPLFRQTYLQTKIDTQNCKWRDQGHIEHWFQMCMIYTKDKPIFQKNFT